MKIVYLILFFVLIIGFYNYFNGYDITLENLDKKCFCFPPKNQICNEYIKHSENIYLAEKTCTTVEQWLGGQNKINYDLVVYYIFDDFKKYVCQEKSSPNCFTAKLAKVTYLEDIKKSLDEIAIPCKCDI